MPKKYDVIVHGYACIDNIISPPKGVVSGAIDTTSPIHFSVGGVDGNTGTALAALGRKVYLAGRVGKDARAASLKKHFELIGAECGFIEDERYATSVSVIVIDPQTGERTIYHNPESNNGISNEDISDDVLNQAKHYHFGYFGLSKGVDIPALLGRAIKKGLKVSFDTGGNLTKRDREYFEECAQKSHIVFPSYDEIKGLTGLRNPRAMCEYMMTLGPEIVGVKLGEDGAIIMSADEWVYQPTFDDVKILSKLAAGDSFFAGLIDAHLSDWDCLEDLLTWANAVASNSVGGISTEVISRMSAEKIRRAYPLKAPQTKWKL